MPNGRRTLNTPVRGPSLSAQLGMTLACLAALLFVFAPGRASAAEVMPPKPAGYFNDYANVVSPEAALRFNEQLAQFERESSTQIVVAVWRKFPSDSSLEDFSQRTFQAWGIGRKESNNNGAVLFVFVDDHKMRIHTGYGLEGVLPDITGREIIAHVIAPRFKANDYEGGFAAGINAMFAAVRGEYKGTGKTVREGEERAGGGSVRWLPILFFILIFIIMARRGRRRGYGYSSGGPFIGGGWGGGGGGWGGGSSGGGFSGFSGGGGSSGGGGASGSW